MRTVAALCRELTADSRHDGELLACFASGTDTAEAAFTELVRRHGPLVWGTCRRLLPAPADAEDAFQASFLVLVRRAQQLTRSRCVGPWLHQVAVWNAKNIRRKNARRFAKQAALPDSEHLPESAPDRDLKADLDAALLALPSRYRDSIVLCHLLGFTRREAAERLGCPEGTLSGWLNRGLAKLRDKLRGLDPTRVLTGATVAVPAALCANTARAAVAATVAAASVPPTVSVLVEGVIRMFWVQKATAAAVAMSAVFALGVGIGLGTRTEYTAATAQEKAPQKGPSAEKPKAKPPVADKANEIAFLETAIREAERKCELQVAHLAFLKANLEAERKKNPDAKAKPEDSADLVKAQREAETLAAELAALKAKLAMLKSEAKPEQPKDPVKEIEALRAEVGLLTQQQRVKELEVAVAAGKLKAAQDKLNQLQGVKIEPGYVELTVTGKAGAIEFVLREVLDHDPKSREARRSYGPVTTRDPAMLQRLLIRTWRNSADQKPLRVIVQPQTTDTAGPLDALKACQYGGYERITFTGYIFDGGTAQELKPEQTGNVQNYTRHDAAKQSTWDLIFAIEYGQRHRR